LDTGTKEFQDMVNAVQPGLYNQIMKLDFRTFTNNVTNYLNAYEDIAKYLNNPTDGFSSLITQYEDAIQRATFAVGQAVPDSFASLISGFKNQLYTLQDNF
jgi:Zn-dependent M32 family carboxypeptidase